MGADGVTVDFWKEVKSERLRASRGGGGVSVYVPKTTRGRDSPGPLQSFSGWKTHRERFLWASRSQSGGILGDAPTASVHPIARAASISTSIVTRCDVKCAMVQPWARKSFGIVLLNDASL